MTSSLPLARRGRAVATSALAAAVLALSLAACGDDAPDAAAEADQFSVPPTSSAPSPSSTDAETDAEPEVETDAETEAPPEDDAPATLSSLGTKDKMKRVDIPGDGAVFADSSSARSDGRTFFVTTAAEEKFSVALPTEAEGWIYDVAIDLGGAGTGYLVTQSGGEFTTTFLVVLDDGELYLPEPDDDVPLGQFVGEGPFFENYTTDAGAHLVTHVKDGGDRYYEWSVQDRRLVATKVA
jgi:hypothetical protein